MERSNEEVEVIKPVLQDDKLIESIEQGLRNTAPGCRLWWLGQSGFLVQSNGRHLLFDPYLSESLTRKYEATEKLHVRISERVISPDRLWFVDVITSTHAHTDHLDASTLVPIINAHMRWLNQGATNLCFGSALIYPTAHEQLVRERTTGSDPRLRPVNAFENVRVAGFRVTAVPASHPNLQTDPVGQNLYLGYVVRMRGLTVYHSGDTVVYDGMVDILRPFNIDIAILPINGKVGNMGGRDAARLAKEIGAKVVIPCHYDMFAFNTADPQDEFIPECERLGQPYRVLRLGERFSSDEIAGLRKG